MTRHLLTACVLLTCCVALGPDVSQAADQPLPEGDGLAARYAGDDGVAQHPQVLFAEDFEAASLSQVLENWTQASNEDDRVLALSDQAPEGGGEQSIRVTATLGENTGGHLYKLLEPGVERAFFRFYVRFPEPANYIHHFVHMGGYHPPTAWPQGGAGQRPEGDDRMTVGIEPFGHNGRVRPPGDWNFYTYWHEMKVSAGGRYWGNALQPPAQQLVPAGRWQCVEVMIQLNSQPDSHDGQLALWLDGKLVGHFVKGRQRGPWTGLGFELLQDGEAGEPFEGFNFRTSDELKINFFWLLHYVTPTSQRRNDVADPAMKNRVWFDQVVVATEYIGPLGLAAEAAE